MSSATGVGHGVGGTRLQGETSPKAAAILAAPDMRVTYGYTGTSPASAPVAVCASRAEGPTLVALLAAADPGAFVVRTFASMEAYLEWWLDMLASPVDRPIPNELPTAVPLTTLLYVLHTIDAYRRAKYQEALDWERKQRLFVRAREFATSVGQSIASRDPRWLLPAFLLVTPGLQDLLGETRLEHFTYLGERGFLGAGQDAASHERVLYFGGPAQRMGEEFLAGWRAAIGLEVAVSTVKGALPVYQAFLAPTALANHLVEVERERADPGSVSHYTMTGHELYTRLAQVFTAALEPAASERALLRAEVVARPTPRKRASRPGAKRASKGRTARRGAGLTPARPPQQPEYSVILDASGERKVSVVQEVCEITGLGLRAAKDLIEARGMIVKAHVTKDEAARLKKRLEDCGATVTVR